MGPPDAANAMNKKISVVINTCNAELHLAKVLESVKEFDEIVVCDMESSDSTADIARNYGCKVVIFPKGEHKICEPARDFAIHLSTNEWVFVVDADEVVPATLKNYLYDLIENRHFDDALAISRINTFWGRRIKGSADYQLRFFIFFYAFWPPVIHARPQVNCAVKNAPATPQLSLIHLDDPTVAQRMAKINVYTDYEIPKRINKKYGYAMMILRPLWFFVRDYFFGKGYRNGRRGIVRAYMASIYQMVLLSKLTEAQFGYKDSDA